MPNPTNIADPKDPGDTPEPVEEPGYLWQGHEQLYYVLHAAAGPRPRIGQVVLVPPFASERPHCYVSWVRWARYLAARGFEVLRFDYRGVGESTGGFAQMGIEEWMSDLLLCIRWLRESSDDCPLILHGLGFGAVLAARAFHQGLGNRLLLWSPPSSARELLYDTLRQRLANDFAVGGKARVGTREQYVKQLESGNDVEVEGYSWSPKLWAQSADWPLILPGSDARAAGELADRPWKVVELDQTAASLLPLARRYGKRTLQPLNPNLSALFNDCFSFIVGDPTRTKESP